jgi:hypothetical protein
MPANSKKCAKLSQESKTEKVPLLLLLWPLYAVQTKIDKVSTQSQMNSLLEDSTTSFNNKNQDPPPNRGITCDT